MKVLRNAARGGKVMIGALAMMVALPLAAAAAESTTTNPFYAQRSARVLEGAFAVQNSEGHTTVSEGQLRVKVFKRTDGRWKLMAKKSVAPQQNGLHMWWHPFELKGVPTRGRCKLVGRYMGTETYAPSKAVVRSKCGAKTWHASP